MTLGIVVGYVVGKPVGIAGGRWLATRLTRGRLRPPVGWAAVVGGGHDRRDRVHRLAARRVSRVRGRRRCGREDRDHRRGAHRDTSSRGSCSAPRRGCPRGCGSGAARHGAEPLTDLYLAVDPERDHIRGPDDAPVTIVEYGDFECPFCGQAEPVIRELLAGSGDLRYVWRHLPLNDVHPRAQLAAEAARRPPIRARSGRCTTCCSPTRTSCGRGISSATPSSSGSTSSGSRDALAAAAGAPGSPRTSTAPTSAASRARRRSSSTAAATTVPTTSRRSRRR